MILIKTQAHVRGVWHYIKPVWHSHSFGDTLVVVGYRWNRKLHRFNLAPVKYCLTNYRIIGMEESELPLRRERERHG